MTSDARDPEWYRTEAARIRQMASRTTNPSLRDSYIKLAKGYESLAATLDIPRQQT